MCLYLAVLGKVCQGGRVALGTTCREDSVVTWELLLVEVDWRRRQLDGCRLVGALFPVTVGLQDPAFQP